MKRKRSISLIEVLIAFSLLGILISFSIEFLFRFSTYFQNASKSKQVMAEKRWVQQVMDDYILHLSNKVPITLDKSALSFVSSGFISRDVDLYGERRITIKQVRNHLIVQEQSLKNPEKVYETRLMEEVSQLKFSFLYPNSSNAHLFEDRPSVSNEFPYAITLHIVKNGAEIPFVLITPPDLLKPLQVIQ